MNVGRLLAIAQLTVAVALLPTDASAQGRNTANTLKLDHPDNRPTATIADMAWLAGNWEGEAFGGTFEEIWGAPADGTMIGMYRLVHEGATTLYEFQLIEEEAGSLVLKVKHFDADLRAWEEKEEYVSFPLVKLTENAVYFEGLTLIRVGEDQLQSFIVISRAGEVEEVELAYRRTNGSHEGISY